MARHLDRPLASNHPSVLRPLPVHPLAGALLFAEMSAFRGTSEVTFQGRQVGF